MANYNIEMKKRNTANNGWDTLYPVTLAQNVAMTDGKSVEQKAAELAPLTHTHSGGTGQGPQITSAGLAAGAANDAAIGSRTVNQVLASPANAGTLTQLLSWLAGRIKAITGATNWYDAPATTLAALNALFSTSGHSHNGTAGQGPKIAYSNLTGAPTSITPTAHASTATTYGVSSATNYGHAKATAAAPLAAGAATVGTDNGLYARGDHVHPVQTSVSGNAGTATKLATARTIGGTSFDGTANIVPANCTLAASATKLATTRTIGGTAFDGTANIVPANCTLAANATKLATARTIALTGAVTGSGSFDGSGNLSIATNAGTAATIVNSGSGDGYYWRKWSNGNMEIWGTITGTLGSMGSHTSGVAITFPVQFPTACKNVIISQPDWKGENAYMWRVLKDSKSIAGFSVKEDRWDNKGAGNPASADYYAFGN